MAADGEERKQENGEIQGAKREERNELEHEELENCVVITSHGFIPSLSISQIVSTTRGVRVPGLYTCVTLKFYPLPFSLMRADPVVRRGLDWCRNHMPPYAVITVSIWSVSLVIDGTEWRSVFPSIRLNLSLLSFLRGSSLRRTERFDGTGRTACQRRNRRRIALPGNPSSISLMAQKRQRIYAPRSEARSRGRLRG